MRDKKEATSVKHGVKQCVRRVSHVLKGTDEGSGTISGVALIAIVAAMLGAVAMAGNLLLCVHRAQNTADLASVAAAHGSNPVPLKARMRWSPCGRPRRCRSHRGSSGSHVRGLLPVIRRLPDSRCMTTRNVQLKVMGNLALDVKHGYRTSMSKTSHANTTVAVVCNPTSNKGKGAQVGGHVIDLLRGAGRKHGFDVIDVTGTSFDDSLANARRRGDEYDYLVAVGGDGMVALGANAVGCSGKPLGIVAIGSGNDFARGLDLPVNRVETAVEGIVGAIVRGTHIDVDMGLVTSLPDGHAIDSTDGTDVSQSRSPIDRYYAGMLSCGLDASINDRANHSHLPNGSLRYFAAVIVELTHMKSYGYHIKATLADGSVEERDIISPLLTVANSRHIGGGIEVSPYSRFADGLLDLVWLDHVPNFRECVDAVARAYHGRLLGSHAFGWKRVRDIEITRATEGDEPPVLMADGEYVGHLPVKVLAKDSALRVLVPPAVAEAQAADSEERVLETIKRDGRDPLTGRFLA